MKKKGKKGKRVRVMDENDRRMRFFRKQQKLEIAKKAVGAREAPMIKTQDSVLAILRSIDTRYKVDPDQGKVFRVSGSTGAVYEIPGRSRTYEGVKSVYFNLSGFFKGEKHREMIYGQNLMWLCKHGYIPPHAHIDFIDGDTTNIRVDNLKLCGLIPEFTVQEQAVEMQRKSPRMPRYHKKVDYVAMVQIRSILNMEPQATAGDVARRVRRDYNSVLYAMKVIRAGLNLKIERKADRKINGKKDRKIGFTRRKSMWIYLLRPSDVFLEIE